MCLFQFWFPQGMYIVVGLLGHMVVLFLVFKGISILFSLCLRWSPGEGKGYPLQYSSLENSMDYTVHGVAKSPTWLTDFHFHFYFHACVISPWFMFKDLWTSTLWTIARRLFLSMGFSRQKYWASGDLPDPCMESAARHLLHCQVNSTWEAIAHTTRLHKLISWKFPR